MVMRLRLIGQMEAWTPTGDSLLPSGRKTRGVLAVVALSAPRPVLRGRLAEMLWSRRPEEQARASLRQEIHRLLEALDPLGLQILAIGRDHLALRPGAVWSDVDEVLRASAANPGGLALFDGELLEDLDGLDPAFDNWLAGERERIGDRARLLAEHMLRAQTEPDATILAAQRLLAIDRAHEGAWRAMMRAYAARGERGMAIQAFERCRAVLMDQLDAEPSAETLRLGAELRAVSSPAVAPVELVRPRVSARSTPQRSGGFAEAQSEFAPDAKAESRADPRIDFRPEARGEPRTDIRNRDTRDSRALPRSGARVGVLPLRLLGTSELEAHLSTGLAEEITNALARFRWMFLVSSASIARFAVQSRDESALRRAFGLDFLLDGTVQRIGDGLRISMRLLDLGRGGQVAWSRRFDRDAGDLMSLQDEVAAEVVAQVDPEILLIESQRVTARPPTEPNAYDLLLRALPLITRMERPLFMQAGELLDRAVSLEPDFAAAHAWYAYWHVFLIDQSWADDAPAGVAEAARLAERAITLDPQDAKALTIAGHVRAFLQRRMREATTLHERALQLNPNLSMAWVLSAMTATYMGDLDEAQRRLDRYKQLSPLDPQAFFYDAARVLVALLKRDHVTAASLGREVTEMNPAYIAAQQVYLAALGHLGEVSEAARVRAHLATLDPGFSITRFLATTALQREGDRAHLAEGLRAAGLADA